MMSSSSSPQVYTTGFVTSKDGTSIGYRKLGQGSGIILVHGGMQASQDFMKLARALSDEFTVYVPDRRGRGLSGGYGDSYGIQRDVEDLDALLSATEAHNVFGLSSGALICLYSALTLSTIHKLALYEPPLVEDASYFRSSLLPRFDREVAQGNIGAALITGLKGTGDTSIFARIPRFLTVALMRYAMKSQASEASGNDVPIKALVPTFHYDVQIVIETEGSFDRFSAVAADVLLLGGSKSAAFLKATLDGLSAILPHVQRVEFPGFDHLAAANDGKPERVAQELRRFFGDPQRQVHFHR